MRISLYFLNWVIVQYKKLKYSTLREIWNAFAHTRPVPKVMHPILILWSIMLQGYAGSMAVDVYPACQYSIVFCCNATHGSA